MSLTTTLSGQSVLPSVSWCLFKMPWRICQDHERGGCFNTTFSLFGPQKAANRFRLVVRMSHHHCKEKIQRGWKNGARDNTQLFAMEFMVDIFPVPQLLLQVGSSLNDPPMYSQRFWISMLSADLTYRRPISEVRGHRMPSTISKAALHLSWLGWLGWNGRNSGQHVTVTASVQRWRCLETAVQPFCRDASGSCGTSTASFGHLIFR